MREGQCGFSCKSGCRRDGQYLGQAFARVHPSHVHSNNPSALLCSLCWTATSALLPSSAMFSASLRAGAASSARLQCRSLATAAPPSSSASSSEPLTHFRITLRRSAISLPSNIKGTLAALGIHRRLQTVYHRHTSDIAGKILTVKELVTVENVPESAVRTKLEQRQERKSSRGYEVSGSKLESEL